jgi:hypothetical protein
MRQIILRSAVATMAVAAPVCATAIAAAAPSGGKATTLSFSAGTTAPPASGRIPSGLAFAAPGFKFDSRAVGKFCKHEQAVLDECPTASRIASGTLLVHVVSSAFTRDTHIPLNVYMSSKKGILGVAFIGGPKVVPGTLTTSGGVSLSFNPLPAVPNYPGVTLTLEQVSLKLGAHRVVVTRTRTRVHRTHRFKTVVKRTRYDLIHGPASCTGSVNTSLSLFFSGTPTVTFTASSPCP